VDIIFQSCLSVEIVNIMLSDDKVIFVGVVVKRYPVIEVVGNVPDPVKKTLSLFESVRTSL